MDKYKWWQSSVFYQIYPRSFADGNGDGIGDFTGMTGKLTYLRDLGINAIWLSPIFPSPNWDCGYDISDYMNIAPEYGNLEDFNVFLDTAHEYGMHVILDLVLNHTSFEHPWFIESQSNQNNPKADWYIWHDPIRMNESDTQILPPNNWQSCFDGPAWTYSLSRSQYYYHYFMQQQPDLNWKNPEVKQAMWNIVRFWLDMGVDGFRLDAIGTIFEDTQLTSHTVPLDLAGLRHLSETAESSDEIELVAQYWKDMFKYQWGGPGTHDLFKELRMIVNEYPGDRVLVGEDDNIGYLGNGNDELHMVFNFPLMQTNHLTPSHIRNNQTDRLRQLNALSSPGWGCNTLGNHDSPRMINRFGDGFHDEELARLHIALLLTLPGTPFLYYGEELGMCDLIIQDPSLLRDTMATWYYSRLVNDLKIPSKEAAVSAGRMSRDKNRTPMQWMNIDNAGFSPKKMSLWLPVNPNYQSGINVADQELQPGSLLNFYRNLLNVRKNLPELQIGDYLLINERDSDIFSFLRFTSTKCVLVYLNFSQSRKEISLSIENCLLGDVIVSYPQTCEYQNGKLIIEPYGIFIAKAKKNL